MNSDPGIPDDHDDFIEEPLIEEHEEHVDERWLVSYADMMTLLFGLFVMLYSMANKFDQVQKSAAKEFSKTETPAVKVNPKVEIDPEELEKLKKDLLDAQAKLEPMKQEMARVTQELTAAQAQLQNKAEVMNTVANLDNEKNTLQAQNEQIRALLEQKDAEKSELERQLASVQNQPPPVSNEAELKKQIAKLKKAPVKVDELKAELEKSEFQQQQLEEKIAQQQQKIAEQESKLKAAQAEQKTPPPPSKRFAAVVITWPTQDHDVDLIVTDPEGIEFNYKHRTKTNHPGKFVLDTRRGPGAEMWQTDKLLPGVYQIKYVFYNTYGNNDPVPVYGHVYSADGLHELPKVELNFNSKREQIFKIRISETGDVTVVH